MTSQAKEQVRAAAFSAAPDDRPYPPISDYGFLSDCHGAALVSIDGSIDWCCLSRFDSRPVFSRILDWGRGGFFRIAPAARREVRRRYLPETHVLETRFVGDEGTLVLTDFLVVAKRPPTTGEGGTERPGAEDRLIRRVHCESGQVSVEVEFVPRFNFGATTPHLRREGPDLLVAFGGADALLLQSDISLEVREEGSAAGRASMRAGDGANFVLTYALPHRLDLTRLDPAEVERRFAWTVDFWSSWIRRCTYHGEYADAVHRSALVLKALTNVETGAIVAAPTTSLPEEVGGVRNWDYRYTWLRDASFVLDSLFLLGFGAEGHAFMDWLHRTTAGIPSQLQIMYGEGGERLLPEVLLEGVDGYGGSRPVRIGNAASKQYQLDIYGEVLHTAWRYHCHHGPVNDDLWQLMKGLVEYVAENWERPDCGLWEVRSEPEHFVHSKVMCWVAADRGIRLAAGLGREHEAAPWHRLRTAIRRQVLAQGVEQTTGRFTRAYGSIYPDAAALLFPLVGFVSIDDPRVHVTRRWIESELSHNGLVRRYSGPDGLPGGEGAFVACSFWLVQSLAHAGEYDRARALFERIVSHANDLGLLSEEIHTGSAELLGNFPQSLSHIGLINAAVALEDSAKGKLPRLEDAVPGAVRDCARQ